MTRADFEADLIREGYEVNEGDLEPNWHSEAHAHGLDARVFVLDGSITLVFGEELCNYEPGDTYSVPEGTTHEGHTEPAGYPSTSSKCLPQTRV
jgi:hypothetical protein